MLTHGKNIKVFTGNSHPELANEIAKILGVPMGASKVSTFSDGEISVDINETVRGADVFIVQSTCSPVNNNLMELLIFTTTLKVRMSWIMKLFVRFCMRWKCCCRNIMEYRARIL